MAVVPTVPQAFQKSKSANFPHLYFEWHEGVGKVYAVEIPGRWIDGIYFEADLTKATADGTCIAEHVSTSAGFLGAVQTYLRGVKRGREERAKGIT